MENKNDKLLKDFADFCVEHPELRFFQALTVWLDVDKVLIEKDGDSHDTYYCESKPRVLIN